MAGCRPVAGSPESGSTCVSGISTLLRNWLSREYWSRGITVFNPSLPPNSCTTTSTRSSAVLERSASTRGLEKLRTVKPPSVAREVERRKSLLFMAGADQIRWRSAAPCMSRNISSSSVGTNWAAGSVVFGSAA
ncbi:MAG: hypothetical protein H6596_04930 [Flavobacteriales bacterium]|nr:hypothetical protein [Flavobacteriales bacterium]